MWGLQLIDQCLWVWSGCFCAKCKRAAFHHGPCLATDPRPFSPMQRKVQGGDLHFHSRPSSVCGFCLGSLRASRATAADAVRMGRSSVFGALHVPEQSPGQVQAATDGRSTLTHSETPYCASALGGAGRPGACAADLAISGTRAPIPSS